MNRIFVRMLGFCVTVLGVNTARTTAVNAGIQESLPYNCETVGSGGYYDNFSYAEVSCRLTSSGFISSDMPRPSECYDGSGATVPFNGCAGGMGAGWCSDTFIFCEDHEFFENRGCVNSGPAADCYFQPTDLDVDVPSGYFFMECTTGYYEVSGGGTGWSYDLMALSSNCAPCSGMRYENGIFETYNNASDTSVSNSGFQWDSDGVGIYSCRAWPLIGTMKLTNTMGTFELTAPCHYVSGTTGR